MLLSIVLMIKNEEKFLENTLKALENLRSKVNSELIILDTGSTDKSVEIAKLYTNKVYFEKWNDNFAKMRNKSISYAKGDWILILDADEELIECENMIEFFVTDLHEKYNCASVELKNISSEDCKSYGKSLNLRLFKNKDFRYEGAIHEQPMYKEPIYNNIAVFNHYGYLYIDEEFKQNKLKRNEKILLDELKKSPNNPYINFQLAKNLIAINKKEEALFYLEKAMDLYDKYNNIPAYVYSNLARLYIDLSKFDKCEKLCIEYLQKKDDKNIDIYYFLGVSQNFLYKYEESLNSYNKYIYLVDHYNTSTQANSIYADGITIGLKKYAHIGIIRDYYYLEKYKEVIEQSKYIDSEELKDIYEILFNSLYKINKTNEILNIYNERKSSKVDTKYIESSLERMILQIKENDKKSIYKLLSNINNSYGLLNKVRLGEKFTINELSRLLLDGKQSHYGDVIYYAINNNLDILELLKNVGYSYMQNYFDYIITHKRDCLPNLYDYLSKLPNTLDLDRLNICSCICRALLFGKGFYRDKYEKIIYMYIKYRYDFIRQTYSNKLDDEKIMNYVSTKEDYFVINICVIEKNKKINSIEYLKQIKKLLVENMEYKDVIEILINKFNNSIKESEEIKNLQIKYKSIIENSINLGQIKEAEKLISEYKTLYEDDVEILNMKGIINILKDNLEEAEIVLKEAAFLDNMDFNTKFNIAYLKEVKSEYEEAIKFYEESISLCDDNELKSDVILKIKKIKMDNKKSESELCTKSQRENIEDLINDNKIDEARNKFEQYKENLRDDISIYSIEGVLLLCEGEIEKAYNIFCEGNKLYSEDVELLYNIAYTNVLLGNKEAAIKNYIKCRDLTKDSSLISEINGNIEELKENGYSNKKKKTIIILDLEKDASIIKAIDKKNNKVILLKNNNKIDNENQYKEDGIIIYETNEDSYINVMKNQIRENEEGVIICSNAGDFNLAKALNSNYKIIYYVDENIVTNKDIYLNVNKEIYIETQVYDTCDLIVTDNIYIYTSMKLIENNTKIYLIDKNQKNVIDFNYIIENYQLINRENSYEKNESRIADANNEYEKLFYLLAHEDNKNERMKFAKYIYEKYNTEEIYRIYISLLNNSKEYKNVIDVITNTDYCSEDFKVELIYLYILEDYELLEFVLNMSIKNYSYLKNMSSSNIEYKMALCNFELGNYSKSYDKYMKLLKIKDYLTKSPIVNKNIGYLLYSNKKDEYKKYYDEYKKMLACLY